MSDLSLIPLQDWFETQLSQDWDGNTGTVYVLSTPSYTPTTSNTYIVVNPWRPNMQIAEITSYDSALKTLTVSSISFEKGIGTSSTAQTHTTGSKVIISDNYQFWEDIKTAINSKLDKTGGNALIYADTTARDTALWANGVPTTPYTNIYVTATGLFYNYNLSTAQWEAIDTGTTPWNATNVSAGLVRSDVAPAGIPVALIQDNPKYDALAGTSGTPSSSNKYVTNDDTSSTPVANKVARYSAGGQLPWLPSQAFFGDGSDWDVTISSNTSLTRDMYYDNLTIQNTFTLSPKGYRIFVKWTLNCEWTGKIASNGWAGGTGGIGVNTWVTPAGGTAWAADYTGATLPTPKVWVSGGAGGGAPWNGNTGTAVTLNETMTSASAGGAGGAGSSGSPGTGWAGGSAGSNPVMRPRTYQSAYNLYDLINSTITRHEIAPTGGGWGGGSGNGGNNMGGGWGGSASTGWFISIFANIINVLNVEAIGWVGGAGGATNIVNTGGGGGWAGGNGWFILLFYGSKTTVTGTVTWGAAGAGWIATAPATNSGVAGTAGNSWVVLQIQI